MIRFSLCSNKPEELTSSLHVSLLLTWHLDDLENSDDVDNLFLKFRQCFVDRLPSAETHAKASVDAVRRRIHRTSELDEKELNGIDAPLCDICNEPCLESELFTCAEDHTIRFRYVSLELSTRASKSVGNLACVRDPNCSHTYSRDLIEEHLSAANSQMLLECPFCVYRGETTKGSFLFICKAPRAPA
ncbi:hypothetical protein BLNAU_9804 [Blattamonas nauphoetae]|uniref:RPA-interacting protein C-terminal domain-containing protein n=1 Tax=Blattamonas nauphoetae TaxID=2049346 RepID=A0ABQ9XUU5_9EUKA|nr:hypothetical protein BLNAU_9804 [Blattamonas nauphoetae]